MPADKELCLQVGCNVREIWEAWLSLTFATVTDLLSLFSIWKLMPNCAIWLALSEENTFCRLKAWFRKEATRTKIFPRETSKSWLKKSLSWIKPRHRRSPLRTTQTEVRNWEWSIVISTFGEIASGKTSSWDIVCRFWYATIWTTNSLWR